MVMTQMSFNIGLEKNKAIDNFNLVEIFKCSPQGGMRRSLKTNTLVIVSDHTIGKYRYVDRWSSALCWYGFEVRSKTGLCSKQN